MLPQGLTFEESTHTYRFYGDYVPSVSSVLKRIKPPFDAPRHAARVAKRRGTTAQAILKEWEANRDAAASGGTNLHACIQDHFLAEFDALNGTTKIRPDPGESPEFRAWLAWWPGNMDVLQIEQILFDPELWIAGTMDLLIFSPKTGKKHVFDWKTAIRFRTASEYNEFLLPPFDDVPSCEFQIYSLQVSLYRLMAERACGEDFGASWILHVTRERATPYKAIDYRTRLWDWLVSYKVAGTVIA